MQLRAQPRIVYLVIHEQSNIDSEFKKGKWGDPIYYRHDNCVSELSTHWVRSKHPLGTILVGTLPSTGVEYRYVIKEYKDGWWKLEWPD